MRSRIYYLLWLLLASGLAASAQTPGPALRPARFDHYITPGPRHWRGTIGQQTVTLDLDSSAWGYHGQYYYDRRGQPIRLSQSEKKERKAGQIRLDETTDWKPTGYFLFVGPLRSPLHGTWRSPDGRRSLPVVLQETYADALAYETAQADLTRFEVDTSFTETSLDSVQFRQYYLRPFLPQNVAAAQRLQRTLGTPVPESQLAGYLDSLLRNRPELAIGYYYHGDKYVLYNSNYLFSVMQFEQFTATEEDAGMYTHEWGQNRTYDLRTGRRLRLADLLLPGYEKPLRRWLLQCLKSVWENQYYGDVGANGKLPAGGFLVTGTRLSFSYDDRDDESLGFPGPYHADRSIEVEISYETLLPIIRPIGPLTALLRERHLLPKK